MSNACVKFEEGSLKPSNGITTKLCGGGCVDDENIIFPETCVSLEYNDIMAWVISNHVRKIQSWDRNDWLTYM